MLPPEIDHHFTIDGEAYWLHEWSRAGLHRMRASWALDIAGNIPALPGGSTLTPLEWSQHLSNVIQAIDGADLWIEAVARECLKEAPPQWWDTLPGPAQSNGTVRRVVTFERISPPLWEAFSAEVNVFLTKQFRQPGTNPGAASQAGAAEPERLAPAQAVSPMLRGRAE